MGMDSPPAVDPFRLSRRHLHALVEDAMLAPGPVLRRAHEAPVQRYLLVRKLAARGSLEMARAECLELSRSLTKGATR